MTTTIDIPDGVLAEAMRHSGAPNEGEAVRRALEEFNKRCRIAALARHAGTFEELMTVEELGQLRAPRP